MVDRRGITNLNELYDPIFIGFIPSSLFVTGLRPLGLVALRGLGRGLRI